MLGDRSPLGFALLFALRSHLGRGRGLTFFTALAIAASVALASGLEMSTRSVQSGLERTADALAGRARLEVTAGGLGVPEALLETIAALPGVQVASPILTTTLRLPAAGGGSRALRVLGVDLLADRGVRGYRLEPDDVRVDDPLRLISQLDSIVITRTLADALDLRLGEPLRALSGSGELELVVRGILRPGGVADAYAGQIAAMDVYALQQHLERAGWLDRIDVVPRPGSDVARLQHRLERAVAGVASVRRPASRSEFAEQVFGTIRLGVWAMAAIGVGVAVLLGHGTTSLWVDARTREFALLQAAGLEARRVRRLVRIDVAIVSGLGTAAGIGLGVLLAGPLFELFSSLSSHLDAGPEAHIRLTASTVGTGLLVGLVVSLTSSLEPSARATSRPPLEVLGNLRRAGPEPPRGRRARTRALLLAAAAIAAAALPLPALARALLLFGGCLGLLVGTVRPLGLPLLQRAATALQPLAPAVAAFLGASLRARPLHLALTLGSIAGIVGGLSSILILLTSVERSFGAWVGGRYDGGIIVTAGDPFDRARRELLSPATVREVRAAATPGDVLESIHATLLYRGREVTLFGRTMGVLRERGRLASIDAPWPRVADALLEGRIAVSDAFERRFGLGAGDRLTLDTPRGAARFEIAGVVRDYYGSAGALHLDLDSFDRFWPRGGAASMVIWPDGDPDAAIERARRSVGARQALFFTPSSEYARWMQRFFERFVSLLWIVAAFSALLGGLAMITLLAGSVMQREHELTRLRVAGATRGLLVGLVLADGMLVAAAGSAAGLAIGWLCSFPLIDVLVEQMGWQVERAVPWDGLLALVGAALLAAALACVHPAWLARRIRPALVGLAD